MNQHFYSIAERLGVLPLRQMALLPGTKGVYRITIHYETKASVDSVATLRCFGTEGVTLEVVYGGRFGHKPIIRRVTLQAYEGFVTALQNLRFDHMPDQDNIPFYGVDGWLIERAAGGFLKRVTLSPQSASGVHAQLVDAVRQYLPDAVREIS
jgi:hypothetical protein